MSELGARRPRPGRIWAVAIGTVIVAGLAVVSFGGFAGAADDGTGSTPSAGAPSGDHPHPQLSDEQKQCLADHGVTLPTRPADGTRPTPPTDDQRAAFRAAAEACGLPTPAGRPWGSGPTTA